MEGTELALDLDGVPAVLLAAQGETDDQTYLWLPEDRVVCCGDNYYQSWPNTAPIRGGQYRDVAAWVRSLDKLLTLPAEHLLPGHTRARRHPGGDRPLPRRPLRGAGRDPAAVGRGAHL